MLVTTGIGNLGRDPELRYTKNNDAVVNFSIASNDKRTNSTTWINVVTFGKQAEICKEYLKKGSKVAISGELQIREFDKKDGSKGTSVEVLASKVEFLSGGSSSGSEESSDF